MKLYKNIPDGKTFFTPKEGDNSIIIIPFTFTGKYYHEYRGHRLGQQLCVCPNSTGVSFCPVCAALNEMNDDDKVVFRSKRRVIYNILNPIHNIMQLWDVAWFFSQAKFSKFGLNINVPTKIKFYFERHRYKYINYHYESAFFKRGVYVPNNLLVKTIDPITILHIPEYDEIEQAFNAVYPIPIENFENFSNNAQKYAKLMTNPSNQIIIDPTKSHRDYKRIIDNE